jgi:arylsulfatase A-like enzyme
MAFATTPRCCPSRASIFTGQYAHSHQVRRNGEGLLLNTDHTLQRYLDDDGYLTGIFGKYLQRWDTARPPPHFDRWAIKNGNRYYGSTWNVDGISRIVYGYSTNYLGAQAREFLHYAEQDDSTPWMMLVAPGAPHAPYTPPVRYSEAPVPPLPISPAVPELDVTDKPTYVQRRTTDGDEINRVQSGQLRTLMSLDDAVASLRTTMNELDEGRDTLAFYLSDNGYLWGEHGLLARRAGKNVPYLESVRIPFLMRWPGHIAKGVRDESLVATIDILPTVLEATGLSAAPDHEVDGKSVMGGSRSSLLLENWGVADIPDWAATVTPTYQYIEYYDAGGTVPEFREYYDLAADPWQLTNLFGDADPTNDPDTAELAAELARHRSCAGSSCP